MLARPEWNDPESDPKPVRVSIDCEKTLVCLCCIAFSVAVWVFILIPGLEWLMQNAIQHEPHRFAVLR